MSKEEATKLYRRESWRELALLVGGLLIFTLATWLSGIDVIQRFGPFLAAIGGIAIAFRLQTRRIGRFRERTGDVEDNFEAS